MYIYMYTYIYISFIIKSTPETPREHHRAQLDTGCLKEGPPQSGPHCTKVDAPLGQRRGEKSQLRLA